MWCRAVVFEEKLHQRTKEILTFIVIREQTGEGLEIQFEDRYVYRKCSCNCVAFLNVWVVFAFSHLFTVRESPSIQKEINLSFEEQKQAVSDADPLPIYISRTEISIPAKMGLPADYGRSFGVLLDTVTTAITTAPLSPGSPLSASPPHCHNYHHVTTVTTVSHHC